MGEASKELSEANDQVESRKIDVEVGGETPSIVDVARGQDSETEEYAKIFLLKAMRLRGVRIDREKFLDSELRRARIDDETIARAISSTPIQAGVPQKILDDIASRAIKFETNKSSLMSFASGLPGGAAMFATLPADLLQYFVHAFRVMQKIAYTYGWQNLLDDVDDIDDETFATMVSLLGVMMGVSGAAQGVRAFAFRTATPVIQKRVTSMALTKQGWYAPTKKVLNIVGIKLTKSTVGKGAAKIVPVLGGVISGGMTFVALTKESKRLKNHLRELPPPCVDGAEFHNIVTGQSATECVEVPPSAVDAELESSELESVERSAEQPTASGLLGQVASGEKEFSPAPKQGEAI